MPATSIHPEQEPHVARWHWGDSDDFKEVVCPSASDALGAILAEIERASAYVGEPYEVADLVSHLNNPEGILFTWEIVKVAPGVRVAW